MKYLAIITITFFTLNAFSQKHIIGVSGGVNFAGIGVSFLGRNHNNLLPGLITGISYERILTNHFSFGAGLLYNQRGSSDYQVWTDCYVGTNWPLDKINIRYEYFSIPIKASYKTTGKLFAIGSIGVMPSLLYQAKSNIPINYFTQGSLETTANETSRTDRFDLGAIVELGLGYNLTDNLSVFTTAGYQHSITGTRPTAFAISSSRFHHYGYMISVGVKYALKKEF